MVDQRRCAFHLARADAERAAAARASCALTSDLHRELADLHAERAWSLQQPEAAAVVDPAWDRQGAPVRSSLIERAEARQA